MAHIDATIIRQHLGNRTTLELCDDFEHLTKSSRRMPWAEQAISDALFERNENAWFAWQFEGNLFGPPMPHRAFGLV
ncbi:hypothetical protein ACFTUC_17405 [Streptomyces sp. NPDC056944]|uniref:hypothetical protein n=1 Tax=Streptomyces sp. NPDC056944 TaxID=3345972 RepID=UPI00363D0371